MPVQEKNNNKKNPVGVFLSRLPDFGLSSSADFSALWICRTITRYWNFCCGKFNSVGWGEENGKVAPTSPRETRIYTNLSYFFLDWVTVWVWSPLQSAQLRVLYRSSSSGLDWPKSMRAGSALNPEPSAGQQEKWRLLFIFNILQYNLC